MIRLVNGSGGGRQAWSQEFSHGVPSGSSWSQYNFNHDLGQVPTDFTLFNLSANALVPDTFTGYNNSTGHWQRWYTFSVTDTSFSILAGRLDSTTSTYRMTAYYEPQN